MSTRRWVLPVLSGLSTTGLGVFINLATEFKTNPWAWAAVFLLSVMGVLLGVGSERLLVARQSVPAAAAGATIVNRGTLITIDGEKHRVKVNTIGAGALVAVSCVVIAAVVAGMLTARATAADVPAPPPPSTSAATADPFHVTVLDEPTATATYGTAFGYLFPSGTVSSLPAPVDPTSCARWSAWALERGGTRVGDTAIAFTVAALGDDAVRVHSARLVVAREEGPVSGDEITCAQGGPIPVSHLVVNLDQEQATYHYPDGPVMQGAARPFGLQIAPGQAEQVHVSATSADCYCSWYLELLIEVNGMEYRHRVDDDGEPFVTAPLHGDYTAYRFDIENNRWEPGIG